MKKKIIFGIIGLLILIGGAGAWYVYSKAFSNNVNAGDKDGYVVYLPTGSNYEQLLDTLKKHDILKDTRSFSMLAEYKGLDEKVKAGRYRIMPGMSNNAMVNMFMSGRQEPVKITFNSVRTREDFANIVGSKLECGSDAILNYMNDSEIASGFGFTRENFPAMFIPNTYEVYWTITPSAFGEKMKKEYDTFWNNERIKKAEEAGLSPVEVCILASIVQGETNKVDEMDDIAGLYINRLRKGWKLEADPTVKYAVGDFSLTRILKKHCETESPYNTYRVEGLPPGPISFADPTSIDQVLNYTKHAYMFMCAREDFSGYHNFAKTNAEHEANARRYQAAFRELERKKKQNASN